MSENAPEAMGVIYRLQIKELHPHPQNPFAVRDDPEINRFGTSDTDSKKLG